MIYTYTGFTCHIYDYWHVHAQNWPRHTWNGCVYYFLNHYLSKFSKLKNQVSNLRFKI
jgi:hypothetical protein